MALQVVISKRAASQVQRRAAWWFENRPAAPGAVAADFGEAVRLLAEQPGIGAKYEGSRTPGVRRLYLDRLEYFIYYKADSKTLRVLAFWGARRDKQPRTWSTLTPNPSFEARPNGKPPGPPPGFVYHPGVGPGVLPLVPPQLER